MLVRISRGDETSTATVEDAADLTRLHVVAPAGLSGEQVSAAVESTGLGRSADAGHVWLNADALHAAGAPNPADPEWEEGFRAMIAYASSRGWLDEDGHSLAAHIEYTD